MRANVWFGFSPSSSHSMNKSLSGIAMVSNLVLWSSDLQANTRIALLFSPQIFHRFRPLLYRWGPGMSHLFHEVFTELCAYVEEDGER